MSPQLIQIAECLNEANTREIKIARCLAESLKRIQELEQFKTEAGQQAEEAEKRFSAALHDLAEQLTKTGEETTSIAQHLSNQINTEKEQFSAELSNVVDQLTKTSEQAKVEFGYKVDEIALKLAELPAQMAAFKAEFAVTSVQADAPKSFNPRGAYESGEKYAPFDYVSANGSSYIALVENPTEPPSKRSKQWMLVAARGASGNGGIISASEVVGLGTAATRNVGQASGNVLELSAGGTATVGDNVSNIGTVVLKSGLASPDVSFRNDDGTLTFSQNGLDINLPSEPGTIALLSQVGDRYLTSSTTSLLIGNGAKTLTVGTGLAYTPTQDVTIAYDVSKHMHASVTSYNSTTGALIVDVNQHTGSGTYAVWTVNVGGIDAGAIPAGGTAGQVLTKVSSTNYDDDWVTPTVAIGSVTGLGTGVATALAVSVGSSGAPVVFNGAGGTPSSITLTNATGYPAATTTTAGTVPTIGATGSTVTGAPTRRQLLVAITNQFAYRILGAMYTSAASSGTGTASASDVCGNIRLTGTTSAGARNIVPPGSPVWGVWNGNFNVVDWGQSLVASGFMDVYHTGTPANDTRIRCGVGKASAAIGQIANRGFMVEIQWNGTNYEVFCGVHNGTTLNLQTTGITFATSRGVLWSLEADGAGNAQWYVSAGGSAAPYNGQARTTITLSQTGAPTGTEAINRYAFIEINNGAAGGAALTVDFQPMSYAFGI